MITLRASVPNPAVGDLLMRFKAHDALFFEQPYSIKPLLCGAFESMVVRFNAVGLIGQ